MSTRSIARTPWARALRLRRALRDQLRAGDRGIERREASGMRRRECEEMSIRRLRRYQHPPRQRVGAHAVREEDERRPFTAGQHAQVVACAADIRREAGLWCDADEAELGDRARGELV